MQNRIIKMTLEYDGTRYAGWQRQINARSIQQAVEESLEQYLGHAVRVTASGRTDAGVHARGQVISFPTQTGTPADAMGRGILKYLPRDIAVTGSVDVPPDFDARRSATMRWYRFFLLNRRPRPAFGANYVAHIRPPLDMTKVRAAAAVFTGDHDFTAFRSTACTASRTCLAMQPIVINELPEGIIQIDFRCRSFLHNMVRIMTGTLVAAGTGKITVGDVEAMLQTGIRHTQIVTAPPNGLFLWEVSYDN